MRSPSTETIPEPERRHSCPGVERTPGSRDGRFALEHLADCLKTSRLGLPVRHFREIDSTNREAHRWAQAGASEGALVLAEHQSSGRGRLGRSWIDLPGQSLLLSLVLRPPVPSARSPEITFVAAVALADAISRWLSPELIEIMWPNDVLLGGRKAAGILLELRCEGQRIEHLVLGVGVNVSGDASELPEDVRARYTSVATWVSKDTPDRLDVLCAFLEELETRYLEFLQGGFEPIRARWNSWFRMAGEHLRVQTASGVVEGRARGLGPAGELILEPKAGDPSRILAGDVERSTTRVS